MIYSHTDNDIYCGLYASSVTDIPLNSCNVKLTQETNYPFDGKINIEVSPETDDSEFILWLRIPTWCNDRFVPGELYSYANPTAGTIQASINGKKVKATITDGYLPIKQAWKKGDKVTLELPMEVHYSVADEHVEADINRLCITRGPLVYCAEQPDNEYPASHYIIPTIDGKEQTNIIGEGILKGIPTISLEAEVLKAEETIPATLKLIPYYAWNNRGDNMTMNVWFARNAETVGK
jgi:DUF1680 family protein